ncbi:sensor histidine kinase [Streptomyces sp. NPDC002004]
MASIPEGGHRLLTPPRPKHPPREQQRLPRRTAHQHEPTRRPPHRGPTIRMRLTLLYGGMFLMAGTVLLLIIYFLAARALRDSGVAFRIHGDHDLRVVSDTCPDVGRARSTDGLDGVMGACLDDQRAASLNSLLQHSLLCLLALAALAFALGYVLAGRALSPLGRITRMARTVAGSELHRRMELAGPDDELKELADTFDEMLDRLDRAFDAQQRFVANASHELRTPLAIQRTLLEVHLSDPGAPLELRQLGRTLLATNDRSERLVEGLLLLARSENGVSERKPVDLAEMAERAVDQVRAEAVADGVELRGRRAPASLRGNGVLLERAALHLVQNAVRHNTLEGGWADVTTSVRSGHAVLTVSNTGPVVPAYQVDGLFEPFRRLRAERTGGDRGVGLGLPIVRSVVRAHGGSVTAVPREGGGLEVRIALPVR